MSLWHTLLYTPLLNFLIYLYNGPAGGNFGVAVIELTIALRLVLMPFTILDERNHQKFEILSADIGRLEKEFKNDPVQFKEKVREILRRNKVSYWSKMFVLGTQLLVLILLYQVFLGGIRFMPTDRLYSWVMPPGVVDTMFLGFNVAKRGFFWPGVVAIYLFLEIFITQRQRKNVVRKSDTMYLVLFPIFSFVLLIFLPMVKSLFVLTSMLFSSLIFAVRKLFFKPKLKK